MDNTTENSLFSPYLRLMRFDKPVGIWLLLFPCWWSVALAAGGKIPFGILLLFLVGAAAMRAAGCIINDLMDRDIDRQVERTKRRPLASGEVSAAEAAILLAFLLVLSFTVALSLGTLAMTLSALWLIPVGLYPLMKRITWWPQLFLGLTFNAGAIIGWAAVQNNVAWPATLLYLGGVFWTLGYDTLYAHQDLRDDARIGVKSSARKLGEATRLWVGIFYMLFILHLAAAAWAAGLSPVFLLFLGLIFILLMMQVWRVNLHDPASCLAAFRANAWVGLLIFIALQISALV